MNAPAQLDFGFPRPLGAETVAKVPSQKQNPLPKRRSYTPTLAPREWEGLPPPRFLSWQAERAWEVCIPQFGEI